MLKKIFSLQDITIFSAAVLTAASIALTKVVSSLWEAITNDSPGVNARLLLEPTSVQSTSYYVSRPDRFRP